MNRLKRCSGGGILLVSVLLSACASLENIVSAPKVSLRNVHVENIGFNSQTFILAFDVTNPNAFPLPIKSINYGVRLDGHRFASGEAASEFTVPARGDREFAISVNVNLLQTAPELLFIVRDATRRDIPYSLEGRLGIDIPYTKPVKFENSGLIRLQAASR
jgi:LEA14-like dessication related protein